MTLINNFCDGNPVEITRLVHETLGKLILIQQRGGSMGFQHSMTPDQAREMAAALIDEANQLEMTL